MRLSLHEVLAIVGRLDDGTGYDTSRERFRRFLTEHMTSVPVARTFLDEAQQLISEQYQRALQDTVLACGRLLGFEVSFADYDRHGTGARHAGQWLSPRRLSVIVQLWSDAAASDIAAVHRAFDLPVTPVDPRLPQARLSVVSASCSSRPRIEEVLTLRRQSGRIISVRSLMDLLGLAPTTSVTHDDVLTLLNPTPALEGSVGLLSRLVHPQRTSPAATQPQVEQTRKDPARWIYVVRDPARLDSEPRAVSEMIAMVVAAGETPGLQSGDALAFLVPPRGIVARAHIDDVRAEGAVPHDESQVRFTIHCRSIEIFDPPIQVGTEQRLNLELQAAVSQEPCVRVTNDEFAALTLPQHAAARIESDTLAQIDAAEVEAADV
jgi:hypothetical protein